MKLYPKAQNQNNKPRPTTLKGVSFAWQDKRVMRVIRDSFTGKKLAVAIAIYQTLTEQASNAGGKQGKAVSEFRAYIYTIANKVGKSRSTIKRYMGDFRRLGVITWTTRKIGLKNMANLFTLCDYSIHNSAPTPFHNKELSTVVHNSEPPIKERRNNSLIINKDVDNQENTNGFKAIKDILDKNNA